MGRVSFYGLGSGGGSHCGYLWSGGSFKYQVMAWIHSGANHKRNVSPYSSPILNTQEACDVPRFMLHFMPQECWSSSITALIRSKTVLQRFNCQALKHINILQRWRTTGRICRWPMPCFLARKPKKPKMEKSSEGESGQQSGEKEKDNERSGDLKKIGRSLVSLKTADLPGFGSSWIWGPNWS